MLCYRDMTFCTAKDCTVKDCPRNIHGDNFTPDEFWKNKVCYADFKSSCPKYMKELAPNE